VKQLPFQIYALELYWVTWMQLFAMVG